MEWISVKDRLPEKVNSDSVYCLVFSTMDYVTVRPYNWKQRCWDTEDGDDYYTSEVGGRITHWMPLPEEPEK